MQDADLSMQFLCDQIRRQASGIVISKTMYRYQNLRFFCNIYIILMLGLKGLKSGTINK